MATHFVNVADNVVDESIDGLVASNPVLRLAGTRVVVRDDWTKVSVVAAVTFAFQSLALVKTKDKIVELVGLMLV
jgi:hypothetical protein